MSMPILETYTAILLPKPLGKNEYIPVSRIEARIEAKSLDDAKSIATAWAVRQLPFHYLDSIS